MLRQILRFPDPRLARPCAPVAADDEARRIAQDLEDTLRFEGGLGLAAPQIGENAAIIAVLDGEDVRVLVNPRIIKRSGIKVTSYEECLSDPISIPEERTVVPVDRDYSITVAAMTTAGEPFFLSAKAMLSFCLQHEIDHLNGLTIFDRLAKRIGVRGKELA